MTKKTFYVTTPIYYSNASPHIGGAYTTIAADILARWNKILGKEVYFLTGTDEHGQKIQETAQKAEKTPKEFVDKIAEEFKNAFQILNISNDNFIRTTDDYHENEVKDILQKLYNKKYIYKGFYEAYYCVGCEQYKTESDLVGGLCPLHNREPELRKEEAYLFKLSKFQDKLLQLIKKGELDIQPSDRRKEIISFLEEGLKDISVSRLKEKTFWGIELPFDKKHTCFVWVDAFWNYISGLKTSANKKKFWPVDVQLMAKDIIRVHATIWPAILLALNYKLPKKMFVHGYFTINGQKMSKSLGNVISPIHLANTYGADSLRYYLMRGIAFGQDGDFQEAALIDRHNNELGNKLGNLVSRVSTLAETYGLKKSTIKTLKSTTMIKEFNKCMDSLEFDKALNAIFAFIDRTNEFIQDKKPWETKDQKVLYEAANAIKDAAILLSPFIPSTAEKIAQTFNFSISLKELKTPLKVAPVKKSAVLFRKIDKLVAPQIKMVETSVAHVPYNDFAKLDLRVAKILSVEDIPNKDKLYKLHISLGSEERTIVAGIKQHYTKEKLHNKKIIVISNLEPAKIAGVESKGMLLAASTQDKNKLALLTPDSDIEEGSKIS